MNGLEKFWSSSNLTTGWHVVRGGNAWCALGPRFDSLISQSGRLGRHAGIGAQCSCGQLGEVPVLPLGDFLALKALGPVTTEQQNRPEAAAASASLPFS
jgi:hypothetical protein